MAICLDSDFIIDLLRGKPIAVNLFNKHKDLEHLFTTEINKFEVFLGIYQKKILNEEEMFVASGFFDSLSILSFDDSCGEIAAKIFASLGKSGNMVGQVDIFIGAIMKNNGCNEIITRNAKDFSRIDGIKIITY